MDQIITHLDNFVTTWEGWNDVITGGLALSAAGGLVNVLKNTFYFVDSVGLFLSSVA
ncbi:hypothetical protein QP027_09795 [Corynebacterium breve]|uniref:Uncharacterized protein n=1 Tax=Corynebacterium breve TaxID=3049799 RepID=A0ABY8VIK0_9CORY|nr:hypothetical protein [Corynebacterium breve]WIM67385.1 hypothetical protein QP027_09795 [Corynebacterium breve]